MQKKQPAYKIFKLIGHKAIAAIGGIAKRSGWDQPLRGTRFYCASSMQNIIGKDISVPYYIKYKFA